MRWMSTGGRWANYPRGFLDVQIERNVKAGHHEWAAARFCRALAFGGLTEREALEAIRDRDCAHLGTGIELWDVGDLLPLGRWFRDAWRRSANGGPIEISMPKARRIQFQRIKNAVSASNTQRVTLGRKLLTPLWGEIGNAIRHAKDHQELQRVWPNSLRRDS